MPKSTITVADEIREILFKTDASVITYSWSEFYEACDREKMKESFKNDLRDQLNARSVAIAYGNAAVIVAKDYNFAPAKR